MLLQGWRALTCHDGRCEVVVLDVQVQERAAAAARGVPCAAAEKRVNQLILA